MNAKIKSLSAALLCGATIGLSLPSHAEVSECIAPSDPGGGWDFTCRSVGRILYDLKMTSSPVQVTNMPGGVGAVAFASIASNRSDDNTLLVATSTVGTTQIAQGRYPASADTMRWLGMLGSDVGVLLVDNESPYQNVTDFLADLKSDPSSLVIAGSSGVGGWDHIRALMLAKESGVSDEQLKDIRWVQFDGGGPAVTQMMGGHVSAVATDLGEIAGFVESGDVRVLAVMSDEPLPAPFDNLPTAKSQGLDVVGYNWRGFYTGGDITDEQYNELVSTLETLYNTPEWQTTATENGLVPIWRGGDEFTAFVKDSIDQMYNISKQIGVIQ